MKKYLLPENGNFYKANLHSHSTVSDGRLTPREMKDFYMDNGYSIIAYTDHNKFVCHNELSDKNFLALNGVEIDINDDIQPRKFGRPVIFVWYHYLINHLIIYLMVFKGCIAVNV